MIYKLVKASSYLFDCSNYIHIYNQIHNTLYMIQKIRKRTLQFLFFLTQSSNWKVQKTLSTTLSRTFCLEAWLYLEPLLMPFLQLRLDPSHQIKQIENQRGKPKRMMKANLGPELVLLASKPGNSSWAPRSYPLSMPQLWSLENNRRFTRYL